ASLESGGPARASQPQVWEEIEQRADRLNADAPTRALHDVYESRRSELRRFHDAIKLRDGQSGTLVALAGRFAILDWVCRPEVFGSRHPAWLQGYALDALEADQAPAPPISEAEDFVSFALRAGVTERDGTGLGREVRFSGRDGLGSGLVVGQELVHLTVHAQGPPADHPSTTRRIRRPSRRRPT